MTPIVLFGALRDPGLLLRYHTFASASSLLEDQGLKKKHVDFISKTNVFLNMFFVV